ncbi:hypothetical protein ACSSS7_006062 [Eimeria intestinalis]
MVAGEEGPLRGGPPYHPSWNGPAMRGVSLGGLARSPGIVVSPSSEALSSHARVLHASKPHGSRGAPPAARSEAAAAPAAAGGGAEEKGGLEALRAAALEASARLAKGIREQIAPTETHLQEAYLFETTSEGPLEGAPIEVKAHGSRDASSSRSGSAAAAAASTAAASPTLVAAAAERRQEHQHEGGGACSGGDGGEPPGGGGSGGCLKPGDLETAAAAGFCSWCCCAFPRLSCPQVSQTTIRRLFKMQRHNFEVAGVRWLCSVLQPSADRQAVGGAILADDPGMGRTCQALMVLSLGYQLGAFTAPSLVVVSGSPCDEISSSSSNSSSNSSNSSNSSSSSKVADLLQMRRWIQLAKDWAPCLAVRPLLCAEDVQGAFLSAHPDGWGGAAAATAAAAVGPSVSSLHAAPAAAGEETVSNKGGEETPASLGPLYVTTFAALLQGQESQPLLDVSQKHASLALVIFDTRCRRQCDRQQQQRQQQQQQQQQVDGVASVSASRCCSALHSEASLSYAAMKAADILWGALPPGPPQAGLEGRHGGPPSPRARVKKLIITDFPKIDSYAALRLLLPHLLPSLFPDPRSIDRLALPGASSQAAASPTATAAPATTTAGATAAAAAVAAAHRFARGCAFPLVLRRPRVSVLIKELPVPRRALHLLALTSAQADAYAEVEAACSQGLLAAAGAAAAPGRHRPGGKGGSAQGSSHQRPQEDVEAITARAVTDMRLVCIHPALVAACSSSNSSNSSSSGERGDGSDDGVSAVAHPLVSPELLEVRPRLLLISDVASTRPRTQLGSAAVCACMQRLVDALAVAAPLTKALQLQDTSSSSSSGSSSGRRAALRRRVQKWREWEVLHVGFQLGLLQPSSVRQQLQQRSSKIVWLVEFLEELRTKPVGVDGETKADEASSREETEGKVLLLNPLPVSCGKEGSTCLLLRDLLLPRPLCIEAKDDPLSATQKIRDFRRAEIQQIQVLLVEDIELLLQLPPHVFSGVRNVVWLSPIVGRGDRRAPHSLSPPPPSGPADGAPPQEAESGATLMLKVEQRLMSVASEAPLSIHYLVCPRTYEECFLRPDVVDAPPFA